MSDGLIKILDGATFVISGRDGDIGTSRRATTGLFTLDTRFLSQWELSINGERLNPLGVDDSHYYQARFFLVPGAATHYVDATLSVIRERSIAGGFEERLVILNHATEAVELDVRLDVDSDFAAAEFALANAAIYQPRRGHRYARIDDGQLRLGYQRERFHREAVVSSSAPAEVDEKGLRYAVRIGPDESWSTQLRVQTLALRRDGTDIRERLSGYHRRGEPEIRQDVADWLDEAPRLECAPESLLTAYRRCLTDLAALRFRPLIFPGRSMPAAGLPTAMTITGRESIITSLQTLPFTPELAATTLDMLALDQGIKLDDFRDEEPGKIMREIRYSEAVAFEERPQSSYYGAADTTPLFLILLDEYERWSGDADRVRELEPEARAALDWIDGYGNLLGDGYLWYRRRNEQTGVVNQCWKESSDAISYHDGRLPGQPRATCELQGYAYDAKLRAARLARLIWGDPALADRLEREAAALKERFNRDFWIADRGYYALALDAEGGQVDALASNIGHLLWSGIVEESRAPKVVDHLLRPEMFTGFGVRTLAANAKRYNPVGYHVGSVWPCDNSLIAWGLRRYGFPDAAALIAAGMIEAAEYFNGRLPEAFGGYDQSLTQHPVDYPTAHCPFAPSTGAMFLFLRTMLGLEAIDGHVVTDPALPPNIERIDLFDIPGRWGRADALGRRRARSHSR